MRISVEMGRRGWFQRMGNEENQEGKWKGGKGEKMRRRL